MDIFSNNEPFFPEAKPAEIGEDDIFDRFLEDVCRGAHTEINFEKIDLQKQDIQMQEARKSVRKEG